MTSPATSCVLMQLEQMQVLNVVLDDENIAEYSSNN
jgi:hypothetical protein